MDGNPCGSVFSTAQVIHISNFKSLSLIVIILWRFEKYALFGCDYISDYPIIAILGFVTSQTV